MRLIAIVTFFLFSQVAFLFGDDKSIYETQTLVPRFEMFFGYYYSSQGSPEKFRYSTFSGPSTELRQKFGQFSELDEYTKKIDDKILLGNLFSLSGVALTAGDIAWFLSYAQTPGITNDSFIAARNYYFGIAGVAIAATIAGGVFAQDAKMLTDEAVWKYNGLVTFQY